MDYLVKSGKYNTLKTHEHENKICKKINNYTKKEIL